MLQKSCFKNERSFSKNNDRGKGQVMMTTHSEMKIEKGEQQTPDD